MSYNQTEPGTEQARKKIRREESPESNTNSLVLVLDHDNPISVKNFILDNNQHSICDGVLKEDIEDAEPSISEDMHKGIIPFVSESNEDICGGVDNSLSVVDTSCITTDITMKLISQAVENEDGDGVSSEQMLYAGPSRQDLSNESLDQKLDIVMKDASDAPAEFVEREEDDKLQSSLGIAVISCSRKKLLVLDVNGLLADVVSPVPDDYKADLMVGMKAVFKRPHCDDFLQFCFERFNVGVWSSRTKRNLDSVLELLLGENRSKLLFCWDQSHCTLTGFNTCENQNKPLVLKELKKLWEKHESGLPWEIGDYNESNTLLLDDSPYKGLKNPPNTAIFPIAYQYKNLKDDSLGPGGDLRFYLEGLSFAANVQKHVEQNPYGQRPITESNPSWHFYAKVIGVKSVKAEDSDVRHESRENTIDRNVELTVCSSTEPFEISRNILKEVTAITDTSCHNPPTHPIEQNRQSRTNVPVRLLSKEDQQRDCSASHVTTRESRPLTIPRSYLGRSREVFRKTKLLILDINGLLVDFISYEPRGYRADSILGDKQVFKRPYCDDFLNFCFEKFYIGFWLTTSRGNVRPNLNFLLGRAARDVLFSWDRSHCFETRFSLPERRDRHIIIKELRKLWEKDDPSLPWGTDEFDQSNTLLVDNNPYTALLNPPHTAIFPPRYYYKDERTDDSLGPGGDLRVFLEGLALAENVQDYVKNNSFGQRPISDKNPSWRYYVTVIEDTKARQRQMAWPQTW